MRLSSCAIPTSFMPPRRNLMTRLTSLTTSNTIHQDSWPPGKAPPVCMTLIPFSVVVTAWNVVASMACASLFRHCVKNFAIVSSSLLFQRNLMLWGYHCRVLVRLLAFYAKLNWFFGKNIIVNICSTSYHLYARFTWYICAVCFSVRDGYAKY